MPLPAPRKAIADMAYNRTPCFPQAFKVTNLVVRGHNEQPSAKKEDNLQKSDVRELRKSLKKAVKGGGMIDWVYGFYVDPDNQDVWEDVRKFYDFEEEEKFRHAAILNKVVSTGIEKELFPVKTEQAEVLIDMRGAWSKEKEETIERLKALKEAVMTQYTHTDPYYATVTHIVYDVKGRASDGAALEDGEAVYDTLVFAICPAKLSAPALGFDNGEVSELSRRWTIGNPSCGFIYPSFDDRCEDRNETSLFSKKDDGMDMLLSLFETKEDAVKEAEQRATWSSILSMSDISAEEAALINEEICNRKADDPDGKFSRTELRQIVEETGADGKSFQEAYENMAGSSEFSPDAISSSSVVMTTDSVKITTSAEKAPQIRTKLVDGVCYILVPLDGPLLVNGVEINASK